MPPKSMFKGKQRPSGFEYPSCASCNNKTSASDAAVAFLSRVDPFSSDLRSWKMKECRKHLNSLRTLCPEFLEELFHFDRINKVLGRTSGGILVPLVEAHVGPAGRALLNVFTAKLGMTLYAEHAGCPIPLDGEVFGMWFLNVGMAEETADGILRVLPDYNTLKQGRRRSVAGQFDYRFNSCGADLVAALSHFHSNIHFFTLAVSKSGRYQLPEDLPRNAARVRPGELLGMIPSPLLVKDYSSVGLAWRRGSDGW